MNSTRPKVKFPVSALKLRALEPLSLLSNGTSPLLISIYSCLFTLLSILLCSSYFPPLTFFHLFPSFLSLLLSSLCPTAILSSLFRQVERNSH